MEPADCNRVLTGLHPGDRISVRWDKTHKPKECYPKEGVVVQATGRFAAVRSPGGFVFCVGAYDLACGVTITRKGGTAV